MEKHPLHLKHPNLQTSSEVNRAVVRQERKTGEKIPNDPAERIDAYMDRLENIFLNPDPHVRERNLEMFRDQIYEELIIKKDNFPESYFELQQRIARERGQPVEEIPEDVREQMMDVAIEDQKYSLDSWIDYLTSEDAVYPAWFKYYAWTQITKLSQFDKERGEFKKRTDTTVAPYPDIYREPLAQIADIYLKVKEDNKHLKDREIRELFSKKFPTLYAELILKSLAASMEGREEIKGQWVKYQKGEVGAAEKLFTSLEGKGTGWCTAGKSTAEKQIEEGDFYVYYTNDSNSEPTQPRLAIRMDGNNNIAEVRGILPHQEVEPIMHEVLDEKLNEFGNEADIYRKRSKDMRHLTALERKKENQEPFTRSDLVFLYEINSQIKGFGYGKDPRIDELRKDRNIEEDILVVLGQEDKPLEKLELARNLDEIREYTKVYVGEIEPGIFQKLPEGIEHVYTSFPEKKIRFKKFNILIGGKTTAKLIEELETAGIKIKYGAKMILENTDFLPTSDAEEMTFVQISIGALGFKGGGDVTKEQVYDRAKAYGLEECPSDAGIYYRFKYIDQPYGPYEDVIIGMKPFTDTDGRTCVFSLGHDNFGLLIKDEYTAFKWDQNLQIVFRLPSKK